MESLISTEECARMLLAAWNTGDFRTIQSAIDETRTVKISFLTGADAERMELVCEAGKVIRAWMHGRKSAVDRDASLQVLRHLVRSFPLRTENLEAMSCGQGSSST
jgi:hypothetical protein